MCIVSRVIDYGMDGPWKKYVPQTPLPYEIGSGDNIPIKPSTLFPFATQKELDELRKDFEEFKKIIKAAIDYDAKTRQPHCESASKVEKLKKIAEILGVDISDLDLQPKVK